MDIGRPPGGFDVVVSDNVKAYIDSEAELNPRIPQIWSDLLDRISITILKQGTRLHREAGHPPTFNFVADEAPDYNLPAIQIICEILGDLLTVTWALVWQEGDHELDDEDDSNRG